MGRKFFAFWRDRSPAPKPAPAAPPAADTAQPAADSVSEAAIDGAQLQAQLGEARATEARVRHKLADLMKAHRERGRLLERSQKVSQDLEAEVARAKERIAGLEGDLHAAREQVAAKAARVTELEALIPQHQTLKTAYEALDGERKDLQGKLTDLSGKLSDLSRSRENLQADRDRLSSQLAPAHATLAARDAEIASLKLAAEDMKEHVASMLRDVDGVKSSNAQLRADLDRAAETEAARTRLELEYEALSARWDVARAQLAEAEQAMKASQATIKAAHRLSSSVEWRTALDGVLDAASELVKFERGTLALVDELQEELKIEAARNSPIAVSEMSRFKVGEGIAGWALSHREPVLVRDSRSDSRFKASDPSHKPRSFIAVPLLAGADGLGVLTLARPATDPFTDADLRSLARVATDAANALIHARLVHVLKQREGELTTLVAKAKELWSAADVKQVIDLVLRDAREFVEGKAALIALRDAKTRELEVAGSDGMPAAILEQRIAWGAPAAADVMRSGKPWVAALRDMLPPALLEVVEAAGLRTLVSVPCGDSGEAQVSQELVLLNRSEVDGQESVVGVLNVYRESGDPISAGQLEQLKAFADQAAVAISNLRRWEKIREQLQATASLNTRLMGRERFIHQLHRRIQQLEEELGRYKAA